MFFPQRRDRAVSRSALQIDALDAQIPARLLRPFIRVALAKGRVLLNAVIIASYMAEKSHVRHSRELSTHFPGDLNVFSQKRHGLPDIFFRIGEQQVSRIQVDFTFFEGVKLFRPNLDVGTKPLDPQIDLGIEGRDALHFFRNIEPIITALFGQESQFFLGSKREW